MGAEVLGLQSMDGETYVGDYIPGANEDTTTVDYSAIVGDSNLWDDLIFDINDSSDNVNDDTDTSPSDTSSSTGTTTEGSSS